LRLVGSKNGQKMDKKACFGAIFGITKHAIRFFVIPWIFATILAKKKRTKVVCRMRVWIAN